MTNKIFRVLSAGLGLSFLVFASGAQAFPGARGPNTPSYITGPTVTPDTDNTVGAHLMRMMNGSMNPNGMLMQHHYQNSGTDLVNPYPIYGGAGRNGTPLTGVQVVSGAANPTSQVDIDVPNFVDPLGQKRMRVEILAFNSASDEIATVNSVTAHDPLSTSVTEVGSFSQADLVFNGVTWDYSYFDFLITPNPDWEEILIDTNGANIAQIFVWTVSEVPVPAAVWLFGSALLGFLGVTRKKSQVAAV